MAQINLPVDDRTREQKENDEALEKERQKTGMGYSDKTKAPMDTRIAMDHGATKKDVMFNLEGFRSMNAPTPVGGQKEGKTDRSLLGASTDGTTEGSADPQRSQEQGQSVMTHYRTLFDAVSSGDVTKLEPLKDYLNKDGILLINTYRPNGKTALMQALLNLKNGKNDAVEYLLGIPGDTNYCKEFVNAAYDAGTDYEGMTALHIAIERRSLRYAKMILDKEAEVHAKACGKFFQPHDQTSFYCGPEVHGMDCGKYYQPRDKTRFCFGELPLSLAACTNQKDMVDLLLEYKAQIRHQDSLGNTVLHALVMVADNSHENTDFVISMYDYILTKDAVQNPEEKPLEDIKNNQGLTPIKLAVKLGKTELFEHILQREFPQENRHLSRKFTEWTYGPVYSSLYDLNSLDTYEKNSVLEMLVYGTDIPNRLKMLQVEPLNELLQDKWYRFGCRVFCMKFIVYIIYVTIFTIVGYKHTEEKPSLFTNTTETILWLIAALGAVYFLIKGVMDLKRKWPIVHTLLEEGYTDLLFFFQAVLFVVSVGLFLCGKQEYVSVLATSMALSLVNLLYFFRGSRQLGIYSVMIQRIVLGDLLRFGFVFSIFLTAFSVAMVTLFNNCTPDGDQKNFCNISSATLELFKLTIGIGELEISDQFQHKEAVYVLLITYIVLTYILLLNMLIALMSKSVEKMSEQSIDIWNLQRAIAILDIEKSLCCVKEKLRSGVGKDLEPLSNKKGDLRWCIRVDELHWEKWNQNLTGNNEQSSVMNDMPFSQTDPHESCSTDEVHQPPPESQQDESYPLVPIKS